MAAKIKSKTKISQIRKLSGLSQFEFADRIGISQGALSQIERGYSHAAFDTLKKISDEFNINCNWLIRGLGDIFLADEPKTTSPVMPSKNKVQIPLVKQEAHAGYVDGCSDDEYIKSLDVYQIPGFEKGNYRLFEVVGDSMIPTIYPGEIVVCEFIKKVKDLNNGTLTVIISKEGIVAKRLFFHDNNKSEFILKSDNLKFRPYSLKEKDIVQVWKIRAKITSLFTDSFDTKRIEKLEEDMENLKTQVKRLKKHG